MVSPPPPAHLSEAARACLRAPGPPARAIDYSDTEAVRRLRREKLPEWEAAAAELTGRWVTAEDEIAGIPVLRVAAAGRPLDAERLIVHLHGGGYVMGNPAVTLTSSVPVAQRTGLPVVSVDYRLAPDHPFPAAVEDATAVLRSLGANRRVVALYGESAGGGLALATAIDLRDSGHPLPDRIGLVAPWADLTCSSDTHRTLGPVDPSFPDPYPLRAMASAYAGDRVEVALASPLFADLSGLPPTLIQVGGREALLGDSVRLAAHLRRAGGSVRLDVWDGMWHVWHNRPALPETIAAFDDLVEFLSA